LVGFLFGVRMEATVHATGLIKARDQREMRALLPGLIEIGWYEGEATDSTKDLTLRVRLDADGNGITDSAQGTVRIVRGYQISDQCRCIKEKLRFHRLHVGDLVWPGQVLGWVKADELVFRSQQLQARLKELEDRKEPASTFVRLRAEVEALQDRLRHAVLRVH